MLVFKLPFLINWLLTKENPNDIVYHIYYLHLFNKCLLRVHYTVLQQMHEWMELPSAEKS